jgi:hypothetical protein
LEAKRITTIANVSPIAGAAETGNDEDIIPGTRYKLQNKIRLLIIYSIKIL